MTSVVPADVPDQLMKEMFENLKYEAVSLVLKNIQDSAKCGEQS